MWSFRARIWHRGPAVKLLAALVPGILLQWYCAIPLPLILAAGFFCLVLLSVAALFPPAKKFRWRPLQGIILNLLVLLAGMFLVTTHDVRNKANWFSRHYSPSHYLILQLEEPLVEKQRSYKAVATIRAVVNKDTIRPCTGKMILYFSKESTVKTLGYGAQLLLRKPVLEISNSGNPSAFDFKRYSLFQGITHQAYVTAMDYSQLKEVKGSWLQRFLIQSRKAVLSVLRRYIDGEKERGLAEALLIGYKDNLDKSLVQAYANTGVVHVIAISGLHLGLIYGILLLLTRPLRHHRWQLLRTIVIIGALWLFSLLAGAQASVLRSAVMFTAIALAVLLNRRSSIYNNMALSAFLLLCYHPFWLWDLGFQLSYAAVLSIMIFFRPVYTALYCRNKLLDAVWGLAAVTFSAQLLTTPLGLFHFHQFPNLFLVTNIIAVPLSSIILIGEILLCLFCFLPAAASVLGLVLEQLIFFMNDYIERIDLLPFARWEGIQLSVLQTITLYLCMAGITGFVMDKNKKAVGLFLFSLLVCIACRTFSVLKAEAQRQIVVYHVPKYKAIDLYAGRNCFFLGDPAVIKDEALTRFHINPARIAARVRPIDFKILQSIRFHGKRILILDQGTIQQQAPRLVVDVLVLSRNAEADLRVLTKALAIGQVVTDSSIPQWKAKKWEEQCRNLQIPCHVVVDKGAFVMKW